MTQTGSDPTPSAEASGASSGGSVVKDTVVGGLAGAIFVAYASLVFLGPRTDGAASPDTTQSQDVVAAVDVALPADPPAAPDTPSAASDIAAPDIAPLDVAPLDVAAGDPAPDARPTPQSAPPSTAPATADPVAAPAEADTAQSSAVDGSPAAMETRLVPPRVAPAAPDVGVASAGRPGVIGVPPPGAPGLEPQLEFLVKFDRSTGEQLRDLFIENPDRAREAFRVMGRNQPAFANLRLKRMTWGGEATLVFAGDMPVSDTDVQQVSDAIVTRLNGAAGVEYAEPNLVGWRGSVEP